MLAPWIISHFPAHRHYVEPFGGGGSILLRKLRCHSEVYNDLGGEIVNVFRIARERGEDLARALELTSYSREEFELSWRPSDDQFEQARRTVCRTFMGFGTNTFRPLAGGVGLVRTGFRQQSSLSGRTPARDWQNYPDALRSICERLQGVVIENRDAQEVMSAHDSSKTLHYVDPPYVSSTRTDDKPDYPHEMTNEDHGALSEFLNTLEGFVVLSGYPSELYEDLYQGWRRVERTALADGGAKRTEVLWMKNVPDESLFGYLK